MSRFPVLWEVHSQAHWERGSMGAQAWGRAERGSDISQVASIQVQS